MEERHPLSDDQGEVIADLMPSNDGPGRPWSEYRLIINGILRNSRASQRYLAVVAIELWPGCVALLPQFARMRPIAEVAASD